MELNLFIARDNSIQMLYQADESRMKYLNTGEIENLGLEFSANIPEPTTELYRNYSWLHMKNPVTQPQTQALSGSLFRQNS
jgi:hypothetical protein